MRNRTSAFIRMAAAARPFPSPPGTSPCSSRRTPTSRAAGAARPPAGNSSSKSPWTEPPLPRQHQRGKQTRCAGAGTKSRHPDLKRPLPGGIGHRLLSERQPLPDPFLRPWGLRRVLPGGRPQAVQMCIRDRPHTAGILNGIHRKTSFFYQYKRKMQFCQQLLLK